jgi:hypothetical protein
VRITRSNAKGTGLIGIPPFPSWYIVLRRPEKQAFLVNVPPAGKPRIAIGKRPHTKAIALVLTGRCSILTPRVLGSPISLFHSE